MATIKQKRVTGGTIRLKRLKNRFPELSSNKWMYVVEFPDGDRGDPRFSKENGVREFERVVATFGGGEETGRRGRDRDSDPFGLGFGGGGGFF